MDKIKPCPFCGDDEQLIMYDDMFVNWIDCGSCDTQGPSAPSGKEAIERWNERQ